MCWMNNNKEESILVQINLVLWQLAPEKTEITTSPVSLSASAECWRWTHPNITVDHRGGSTDRVWMTAYGWSIINELLLTFPVRFASPATGSRINTGKTHLFLFTPEGAQSNLSVNAAIFAKNGNATSSSFTQLVEVHNFDHWNLVKVHKAHIYNVSHWPAALKKRIMNIIATLRCVLNTRTA